MCVFVCLSVCVFVFCDVTPKCVTYPAPLWWVKLVPVPVPGYKMSYSNPAYCSTGVQNAHKFRGQVIISYKSHRSVGYGYECLAEPIEVLGTGNTTG